MRPRLPAILALLLIGVLLNVAVAWTCAYLGAFGAFTARQYDVGGGRYWSVLLWESFGSRRLVYVQDVSDLIDIRGLEGPLPPLPAWCRLGRAERSSPGSTVVLEAAEAHGWPLLSMSTAFASGTPPPSFHARGPLEGVEIEPPADAANLYDASGRTLPLRPVWLGFAADTLFFAVVAWLLISVPVVLRRVSRAGRGVCPACGYPPGESAVCPECGTPRTKEPATTAEEAD
jgi:hypothetical protein